MSSRGALPFPLAFLLSVSKGETLHDIKHYGQHCKADVYAIVAVFVARKFAASLERERDADVVSLVRRIRLRQAHKDEQKTKYTHVHA